MRGSCRTREHPDPELVVRHEALGDLPVGTFGRTFFDFYWQNGFAFAGDPAGVNVEFATPHDSTHVLSGYDTTPQGELLVSTFTAGMHPHEPMSGHILPVIMTWHLGVELVQFAGKFSGALDPEKFWVAWDRGSERHRRCLRARVGLLGRGRAAARGAARRVLGSGPRSALRRARRRARLVRPSA